MRVLFAFLIFNRPQNNREEDTSSGASVGGQEGSCVDCDRKLRSRGQGEIGQ